ncbi:Imm45 family immunity protein [Paracidovorax konjaci]|uniref:Imm45 family immunity protein n=1 Tax=Paracidovorax konjaci TaxID=32040 RepID=UPI0011137A4C|nr:Imm45 family immunity protein [Paracidovorax konjaci]
MTEKINLANHQENLERGCILRCESNVDNQVDAVDLMIIELNINKEREYALLIITGYKAGLIYTILPKESFPSTEEGHVIDIEWLRSNWNKWGYLGFAEKDVYVIKNA